jgi:hypothetical protein
MRNYDNPRNQYDTFVYLWANGKSLATLEVFTIMFGNDGLIIKNGVATWN